MKLLLLEFWMVSTGGLNSLSTSVAKCIRSTEINCIYFWLWNTLIWITLYINIKMLLSFPREVLSAVKFLGFVSDLGFFIYNLEIPVCPKSLLYKMLYKYSIQKWTAMWICLFFGFAFAISFFKVKWNSTVQYSFLPRSFQNNLKASENRL